MANVPFKAVLILLYLDVYLVTELNVNTKIK